MFTLARSRLRHTLMMTDTFQPLPPHRPIHLDATVAANICPQSTAAAEAAGIGSTAIAVVAGGRADEIKAMENCLPHALQVINTNI